MAILLKIYSKTTSKNSSFKQDFNVNTIDHLYTITKCNIHNSYNPNTVYASSIDHYDPINNIEYIKKEEHHSNNEETVYVMHEEIVVEDHYIDAPEFQPNIPEPSAPLADDIYAENPDLSINQPPSYNNPHYDDDSLPPSYDASLKNLHNDFASPPSYDDSMQDYNMTPSYDEVMQDVFNITSVGCVCE